MEFKWKTFDEAKLDVFTLDDGKFKPDFGRLSKMLKDAWNRTQEDQEAKRIENMAKPKDRQK